MAQSMKQPTINLDYEWQKNEVPIQHKIVYVPYTQAVESRTTTNFPLEGLSRPAGHFEADGNVETFMQAACDMFELRGCSIVVGGLGNHISNKIVLKMVRVAAANGVSQIYTGIDSILSRPAMSYLTNKIGCYGFLIHNCRRMLPKYGDEFLSIDVINPKGRASNPDIMEDLIIFSQKIEGYFIISTVYYNDRAVNTKLFVFKEPAQLTISVVDTVSEYAELLKTIFDFDKINELLSGAKYFRPFRILIDCNGGSGGAYAKRIFEVELGAISSVVNHRPTDRPRALHPSQIGSLPIEPEMKSTTADFGASLDTDGSRAMLFGHGGFHIPSGETLAVITSHFQCIPHFQKHPFNGVSRTFFTTPSADDVVKKTPVALKVAAESWLHFNKLMEDECVLVCEDENFGVGSNHVGCSDGIWAVLAWLSLVFHLHKPVMNIMKDHWTTHGRYFMTVYEFHNISKDILQKSMRYLQFKIFPDENFMCSSHTFDSTTYKIAEAKQLMFHGS